MKRDKTGKFTCNWNSEPKQAVNLSLTKTAWQILEERAKASGVSRSELVERFARTLASLSDSEGGGEGDRSLGAEIPESLDSDRTNCGLQERVVELQRTIDALHSCEQQSSQIIDAIPQIVWTCKPNGEVEYFNRQALDAFGITLEQLLSQGWHPLVHSEDLQRTLDTWTKAVSEQTHFQIEYRLKMADGSYRWYLGRGVPDLDAEGKVTRWFGTCTDIDDRKRLEETRENQGKWFEAVLNLLPIPLILIDPETAKFTFANLAANEMAGDDILKDRRAGTYEEKYYCTDATGQLIPPEELPVFRVINGEKIEGAELNWHTPMGVYSLLVFADTLPAMHSRPATCVLTFQDIFVRKQMEWQLQKSQRFIEQIADATPGLLYVYDLIEQRNIYTNRQSVELLGYTPQQVRAMKNQFFSQLMHPDDLATLDNHVELFKHARDGEIVEREYRMRDANGEWHWFWSRDSVFSRTKDGSPHQIIGISVDIDARKRAEFALQASKHRYTQILDSVREMIFCKAPGSVIVYANKATCDYFGMSGEEMVGVIDGPFKDVDYTSQHIRDDIRVFTTKEPVEVLEEPNRRADGEIRYFHTVKSPIFDIEGNVVEIVGVARDITDRKQTKEALRLSQERYRSLAESLPQLVCMSGANGKTDYCNQSWIHYTGLNLEQTLGSGWESAIHPEDLPAAIANWKAALANGNAYSIEFRIRRHDGVYRWHLNKIVPIRGENGNIVSWLGAATDVDDRKRIEQREHFLARASQTFAEAESDLQSLLDTISRLASEFSQDVCVLSLLSPDGQFLETVSCYHVDPEVENLARLLVAKYPRTASEELEWQVIQTKEPLSISITSQEEFRATVKPEYWIYLDRFKVCSVLLLPLRVQGQVMGVLSLTRNHPADPHEPEDLNLFQDLADRAAMAIARVRAYEAETRARAQAEAANRTKDEFLAVLSHELRTPMNPIIGWTTLLRSGRLDADRIALAIETIDRNAKLQVQLIEDLLDISSIMRGKFSLNSAAIDLASIIEAAIQTIRLAAEAKAIKIQTVLPEHPINVLGDALRLQQVVWNLLSNAVKFTPSRGSIKVELEKSDFHALIRVADNGKGIAPDFLPHVFEYFRQADSTITRSHGGLGLGLAIVRYIVELHGGTVKAESQGEGKGATFTVVFPLSFETRLPNKKMISTSDEPILQGIRVLAVDDKADNLDLIAFILEQVGAEVIPAASATEVLDSISRTRPDILLCDIGMPEMDGYSLLRRIRELSPASGGKIPAIAITAYAGELDREEALAAGFQLHLPKPLDSEELIRAVAKLAKPESI